MNAFNIGVSALATAQAGLDLVGQNISNVSTPGYHRQSLRQASRAVIGARVGTGVSVAGYVRAEAPTIRTAILNGRGQDGYITARLDTRRQIETAFGTSNNSLGTQLDGLFNKIEQLSAQPTDNALRRDVVQSAGDIGRTFQTIGQDLDTTKQNVGQNLVQQVNEVNAYSLQVADLNAKIENAIKIGTQPNDLLDQRDKLVEEIAKRVDVRLSQQPNGVVNVFSSSGPLVIGNSSIVLNTSYSPGNNITISYAGTTNPITVLGGSVGGLQEEYNTNIPATRARLDALAQQVIKSVDTAQATGLGLNGPLVASYGVRPVTDPAALLSTQNLPIPLQAGNLIISVTNTVTGNRTNATVAIDPATQSLNALATAITTATGGQVQATVNTTTNTLEFQAQTGFKFDFAGRSPNPPNSVAIGGTSVPAVGGAYTGANNDNYTFQITGTGTIGVTAGLSLQVRNSANQVVATVDVGSNYTAGAPIKIGNGVTVSLTAGTTTNGSFSSPVISQPDSANLLAGLGINGLFKGVSATDIAARPEFSTDPSLLAASRTGQSGDTTNLTKFGALRDTTFFGGVRTISQEFSDIAASIGTDVSSLNSRQTSQAGLLQSLVNQEQAVVGVDINEETVKLLDYQKSVQAASKYIAVVNEALASILAIL